MTMDTWLDRRLGVAADEISAFLRKQSFMDWFSDEEIGAFAALLAVRVYAKGDVILREGDLSETLFFVYRGTVDVLKHEVVGGKTMAIHTIETGGVFGEMSFLDPYPASATIQATENTLVLFITRDRLSRLVDGPGRALHHQLTTSVAVAVIRRLRLLSGAHVKTLQAELDQIRLRNEFARFFIITLILFGIASLVQKLINTGLPPSLQMLYSWGFLLLTFAPIAYFTRKQQAPLSTFGLGLTNWRRSLGEGLLFSALIAVTAVLVRYATVPAGVPFVNWGSLANYSPGEFNFFFAAYLPHCFLQEFIGRGVIQGSLQRFLTESRPIVPIVVTSALFGIFHFHVSLTFALVTFVVSVLFGFIYARHGTLLGVTLTHYALGVISIVLGFN